MKRILLFTLTLCVGCGSGSNVELLATGNEVLNSTDIKASGNYIDEAFFDEMTFD
tara:strand:+ start:682 stop:846 length:165 start_codon:yes stop_codon:yes gene_type:complete